MKVFVFDLLAYAEHLDHLKDGQSCRSRCRGATSSRTSRCGPMQSTSTAWEELDRLGYDGVASTSTTARPTA